MNKEEIKELIRDILTECLEEAKQKKMVVRGGKKKRVTTDSSRGRKIVGGKSRSMKAGERIKRSRSGRIAGLKKKSKQRQINRKRAKSMRKRKSMGM